MKNFFNLYHKVIICYAAFIMAIGFGIAGIAIYPYGVIHGSVLILIAQLLVLSATFAGLNVKFDLERKYFHAHNENSSKNDVQQIQEMVDKQYGQIDGNSGDDEAEEITKDD